MQAANEIDHNEYPPGEEKWMQELLWPSSSSHHQHADDDDQHLVYYDRELALARPCDSDSDSQPQHLVNGLPSLPQQSTNNSIKEKHQLSNKLMQQKVALETKSDIDILDDGFKWRKYGQKSVKNSKHPRSYYRCSMVGCPVKKRVERSTLDPSLVVTTYHSMHNHHSTTITHNMDSSWLSLSEKN